MPVQLRPYLLAAPGLSHGNNLVYTYGAGIRDYLRKYKLCGLQDGDFCHIPLHSTSVTDLHAALAEVEKDAGVNTADATTSVLVFLLLPSRSPQTYQGFKDLVDRKFGFHSICVTEAANIETKPKKGTEVGDLRPLNQYLGNVMMKVNLKFGGTNHSTELVRGKMKNTWILGADVSHAGPGAIQYCPAIAAIVGSVDDIGGQYLGSMRLQTEEATDWEVSPRHVFLTPFLTSLDHSTRRADGIGTSDGMVAQSQGHPTRKHHLLPGRSF
jgi:hypothetical protein